MVIIMKKITTILILSVLASCTTTPTGWDLGNNFDASERVAGVRISAGMVSGNMDTVSVERVNNKYTSTERTTSGSFGGSGDRQKAEGFAVLHDGRLEVGAFYALSELEYEGVDGVRATGLSETVDIGMVTRLFMRDAEKTLRPYAEARVGYREQTLGSTVPGSEDIRQTGEGLLLGLGAGMEVAITEQLGAFAQVDFDYSEIEIGDTFAASNAEVSLMLGGVIKF